MKLVVAESLILVGVLLLAAYVLSDFVSAEELHQSGWIYRLAGRLPGYALRQPALVVLPCIALYWGLQLLGHSRFAFWAILLLVVLLQGPAIWPTINCSCSTSLAYRPTWSRLKAKCGKLPSS